MDQEQINKFLAIERNAMHRHDRHDELSPEELERLVPSDPDNVDIVKGDKLVPLSEAAADKEAQDTKRTSDSAGYKNPGYLFRKS